MTVKPSQDFVGPHDFFFQVINFFLNTQVLNILKEDNLINTFNKYISFQWMVWEGEDGTGCGV